MRRIILMICAILFCLKIGAQVNAPEERPKSQNDLGSQREDEREVVVFPNPSTGKVFLSVSGFKGERIEVRVMNVIGNVVHRENSYETEDKATKMLDLSKFDSGLYYIKLEADEYSEIRKVIIN